MNLSRSRFAFCISFVVSMCCGIAAPAWAFDLSPRPGFVVEYFNTTLGHYFYTPHAGEQNYIDTGMAGPGWVRTGLGFGAWRTLDDSRYLGGGPACDSYALNPCQPITRFYGTPGIGPNSHFFTGVAAEVAALANPAGGWSREGVSFYVPLPDAEGNCFPGSMPVYRLYNNRWMHNDSNHRYVANVRARQLLRGAGWTEEGVAFCAYPGGTQPVGPIEPYKNVGRDRVISHAECRGSASGSCIGLFNLGLALEGYNAAPRYHDVFTDAFNNQVGWDVSGGMILATLVSSREIAAANTFVHLPDQGDYLGIHLNTANRLALPLTAITPIRKASTPVRPGEVRYGTEYQLSFDFMIGLNKLSAAAGSAAYGAVSVEFRDTKSGRKFQFNALAYGTIAGATYIGPDAKTGIPIVGVSFGAANPYSRVIGNYLSERTTPGRASETYRWRFFTLRIDGDEFSAMVRAARSVDGALSDDPRDYVVDNFGIVNEVAGDGEIAGFMQPPTMSMFPRD
jgi:hypothetical protein